MKDLTKREAEGGYEIPDNFGALPYDLSLYKTAKAVILPVPYGGTLTYGLGAEKGPKAIIKASKNIEFYDEELQKNTCMVGIHTCKPLKAEKKPEKMVSSVYERIKKLLKDRKFVVTLGGEHSISFGCVKAYKEKFSELGVLQLDAHSDLRNKYNGSKFSHACTMRRISEIAPFVALGVRSLCSDEASLINKKKYDVYFAKELHENKKSWKEVLKKIGKLPQNLYITIDLDFFDPSVMGSTGTPEPGGFLWNETMNFLGKIFKQKNVVGFDVVELSPIKLISHPDFMAAKLVYKLLGYKFE